MATLLKIEDIHKTFEAGTVNENHVLKGLDLTVEEGDFISVIGGNGAGKSTLMNILAGGLQVDQGEILLEGKSIKQTSVRKRAKDIARVFQDPKMGTASRLTIEENMAIAKKRGARRGLSWGVKEKDREEFKTALKELNIGLENRLKVDTQYLSGGQRQALTLVMAALVKPKLLLLDEHTAALDPKTASKVLELTEQIVGERKLTTLMVTHNMNDAIRLGNRLIMMHEGRVIYDVAGEEKRALTVPDLLQKFEEVSGGELANDRMLLS